VSRGAGTTCGGFTLVEMLVALAVFGLLCAAGVAVMAHTVDNQGQVGARMDRLGDFQRTRTLLKLDLAQAAVRRVRHADGSPLRSAFSGAPLAGDGVLLEFTRRGWDNPEAQPRASLQRVRYRVAGGALVRESHPAVDGTAAVKTQTLLSGVQSANVSYFHRGQWLPGWPGARDELPQAVRIDIATQDFGLLQQLYLVPGGRP
jgi:general secretion pathway protein J